MISLDLNGNLSLIKWQTSILFRNFRTPNNLKNLYYTVIRNLMKLLFRKNSQFCPKVTG